MKKLLALFLALVMAVSLASCGGGNDNGGGNDTSVSVNILSDLKTEIATEYPNADCNAGSDGSYLKIDTNPNDEDYDDLYSYQKEDFENALSDGLDAIKFVNSRLGFPESLYEKMTSTTSMQGAQNEENELYKVMWTYHPDNGLEVMYEKK